MSIPLHDIVVHELVGLEAHVVQSTDPGHVCKSGVIRSESRNMLEIESSSGLVKVPKEACVLEITLPD